jgi:HSP20 family molecular chaperone IbpA
MAADQITTNYKDGILSITVPLHEVNRPRRIPITSSQPQQQTVESGAS